MSEDAHQKLTDERLSPLLAVSVRPAHYPRATKDDEAKLDATPTRRERHRRRRRRRRKVLIAEWIAVALAAVLIAFGLRSFVVQAFYVPSASMYPALQVGDRILVDKFLFHPSSIHEGEIVVFHRSPRDPDTATADLVKRVIGLPGQTIWSKGNTIYINGHRLREPYLPAHDPLGGTPIVRQRIPAGEYFVMGDNRSNSYDSRYWGPIAGSSIIGKVVLLIWRHGHPAFHIY